MLRLKNGASWGLESFCEKFVQGQERDSVALYDILQICAKASSLYRKTIPSLDKGPTNLSAYSKNCFEGVYVDGSADHTGKRWRRPKRSRFSGSQVLRFENLEIVK